MPLVFSDRGRFVSDFGGEYSQRVSDALRDDARGLLQSFVQKINGMKGAVIATSDGFEVAQDIMSGADGAKLSAMASSISAIGNMVTQETDTGDRHRCIVIEGEQGYILIMDIPHSSCPMILNVITSKSAVLGQVIYHAKQVVGELSDA